MMKDRINLNGHALAYSDSGGAGPVLILSSGVGQSAEFWVRQFEGLADRFRIIAWDYPAHGDSDVGAGRFSVDSLAQMCLELMDRLDIREAFLVGNSLGGAVSLRVQSYAPDRVQGLVLAAPALTGRKVFAPFKLFTLPLIGPLLTKPSDKGVAMQVAGVFHPDFTPDEALLSAIRRNIFKQGAQGPFLDFMRATLSLSGVRGSVVAEMRQLYRACTCPILFVHGRQDKIVPYEQSQDCAALAGQARLEIFENCGHAPQVEQPERFNHLIADFVAALLGHDAAQQSFR